MLFRICNKSICIVIVLALMVSCSDDPANKAAKELRQSASKALKAGTNEKVLNDLNKALKRSSTAAGQAADPVRLTAVNIALDRARELLEKLDGFDSQASEGLGKISLTVRNANELQLEYEHLSKIISATSEQIKLLETQIDGTKNYPGIKEQLAAVTTNISELTEQRDHYLGRAKLAQKRADDIQQQSDEKLKLSETARGQEKTRLQRQCYDLLYSKKEFVLEAQETLDEAGLIQSQIDIAAPLAEKLGKDLALLSEQVASIKNSPQKAKRSSRLKELKKQIGNASKKVEDIIGQLQTLIQQHNQIIQQITTTVEDGEKLCKKISGSLRQTARAKLADCLLTRATAAARGAMFNEHIMLRLQSAASGSATSGDALNNMAGKCSSALADYAGKAIEGFGGAAEEYLKLAEKSRGSSGSACAMTKNAMLALHEKILIAEAIEEDDAAEEAMEAAEQLTEKIQECDPDFQLTALGQFTQGRTRYTPAMELDSETYYQGLQKQLQSWKKLTGDAKKAEAARLLAQLGEMTNPRDPETFDRIIGPEIALLKKEVSEESQETSSTDPNNF
jgi:hypothetical protein